MIYRLEERIGGTENHSPVVRQSSWPSHPFSRPGLTAFICECNRMDGFETWVSTKTPRGLVCSHVGGQGVRGSYCLLEGFITMVADQMRVSSKKIIAVYKVLYSNDSRKFSFLNVPSCPTMISKDPIQQWLAGSDPIYPGGTQQILCELQKTHS